MMKQLILAAAVFGTGMLVGCEGQPTVFPNPDKSLRKSATQFAADAAKRHPFKADAPLLKEPKARAQVAYSLNRVEIVNFTEEDWSDVEVWVNRKYVCHIPKMESRKLKEVHFSMLFDDQGKFFPFDNKKMRVEKVEVYRGGKVYEIVSHNADY